MQAKRFGFFCLILGVCGLSFGLKGEMRGAPTPELGQEVIPQHEALDIDLITGMILDLLKAQQEKTPGAIVERDAHPKAHGCVKARFTVNADLPRALRQGLFAEAGDLSGLDSLF